ncbi:MAG: helicase-related protein [Acidobacteriota bacterium]|nr:helicase-related protein [Acidobacteriota bacterium]
MGISENPKAEEALSRILHDYGKGNQIIFTDLTEAQEGMRQLLVQHGIPAKEIAVINGQVNADKRLQIQDKYNSGQYKIVIGGAAASVGIDLQINTISIHHLSLPWEGQTVHQRNGRGVRQGNQRDTVQVYYYVLKGSTDTYRLATISTKTTWFNSMRQAQTDDIAENIFADPVPDEMIASMADNPQEALEMLRKQRRQREEKAEYNTYMSVFSSMQSYMGGDPTNQLILASLQKRVRKLKWISQSAVDEAFLRAKLVQELREEATKFNNPYFYFLPGYKWKDQFHLKDEGTFLYTREELYFKKYRTHFDNITPFFPEPERQTPDMDQTPIPETPAAEVHPVAPETPVIPPPEPKPTPKSIEKKSSQATSPGAKPAATNPRPGKKATKRRNRGIQRAFPFGSPVPQKTAGKPTTPAPTSGEQLSLWELMN